MRLNDNRTKKHSSNRIPYVVGILFLFAGILVLLSLVSYNHADPSFLTRSRRLPTNYIGRIGANAAEILIQLFGLASFLLGTLMLTLSIKTFQRARIFSSVANIIVQSVAVLTCATFLNLHIGSIAYGGTILASGGWVGEKLAELALHYLNLWGATLLTLCVLLMAAAYATPSSVSYVAKTLSKAVASIVILTSTGSMQIARAGMQTLISSARQLIREIRSRAELARVDKKQAAPPVNPPIIGATIGKSSAPQSKPSESFDQDEIASKVSFFAPAKAERKPPRSSAVGTSVKSGTYQLPSLDLLNSPVRIHGELDKNKLLENSKILETKLSDFGIEGQVVAVRPGPVITMYEFKPGAGVKISQIAALADDLSLALSAQSVRIVAPIPGKSVVGIEIPNEVREKVYLREILSVSDFSGNGMAIPLAVGKDISGHPVVADLARMPHLLIAGAPGAGKSVFINSLISSLLYKFTPNEMRMIMVDHKQLELNLYENIPHLLLPVVDDPRKAATALKWAVNEMERRYKVMSRAGVRNIAGFNQRLETDGPAKLVKELCPQDEAGMPLPSSVSHLLEHDEKGLPRLESFPSILVIIDEFADLMMAAPKDIETSVARLAQKARAAGIHLVIATQRPSVDVITGLIKANLPSRISFQVASKIDSRTILDGMGAEKLLGQGDMLFIPPGLSRLVRLHGAFLTEEEIEKICDHWRKQGAPAFREEILLEPEDANGDEADGVGDELYPQAVSIVRELGQASASMLQRRLKVGYNRAARMVEAMEAQGIVGPADGAKPREVIY